jgi:hypothetical protein
VTDIAASRWIVVLLAAALGGCSRSVPLGSVEGTVRLDGRPIADVMVTFIPEDGHQPHSTGVTDASGHFRLRCNNGALGAVVGEDRVTVIDAAGAPAARSKIDDELPEGAAAPPSRVSEISTRPDRTPLRQSVVAGPQNVTIDIRA